MNDNTIEDEFFDAEEGDDMSTSQRSEQDDDDEQEYYLLDEAQGDMNEEASLLSSASSSSSSEAPTHRDNRSYLPGASHPLLHEGAFRPNTSRDSGDNQTDENYTPQQAPSEQTQIPILELPGIVLFPGCTIPIRLSNRSWIQTLGARIDASRRVGSPDFGRPVQLGVLTREEDPPPETRARTENGRRRASFLRQGFRSTRQQQRLSLILQQELGDLSDSSSDEAEPTAAAVYKHPFIGRIGTIATVTYTHGDAVLEGGSSNNHTNTISRASGVWQRHAEEQGELILQAVGTNRFRVETYLDFQSFADVQVFQVQEFQQDNRPLQCPQTRILQRKLPYNSKCVDTDETTLDTTGDDNKSNHTRRSSLRSSIHRSRSSTPNLNTQYYRSHHDSLIQQLSLVTPMPQLVYKKVWPWRIIGQMVQAIQAKGGSRHHPQEHNYNNGGDDQPTSSSSSLLQSLAELLQDPEIASLMDHPTQFSFWMASNMPLSIDQKLHLLSTPTTVERLLTLQKHLQEFTAAAAPMKICCQACHISLSNIDCVFTVGGADGTTSNHVNEHGFIHQVVTLRRVNDERLLYLSGRASTENSYFPGYSWTITYCNRCGSLLGWKFNWVGGDVSVLEDASTTTGGGTSESVRSRRSSRRRRSSENRPPSFFGFMSSSLMTQPADA